jgi:hypothetical protein
MTYFLKEKVISPSHIILNSSLFTTFLEIIAKIIKKKINY